MNYKKGNILESNTEVIINPVNIVGVMGKGLALQFKQKWLSDNFCGSRQCRHHSLQAMFYFTIDNVIIFDN